MNTKKPVFKRLQLINIKGTVGEEFIQKRDTKKWLFD